MPTMTVAEAREYLTGFDHCGHSLAVDYLNVALDRLLATLNLIPTLDGKPSLLELGAHPYFMTALMLQQFPNYQLVLANEPMMKDVDGGRGRIVNRTRGVDYRFEYEGFNIETDRFPYDDQSMDVVVYCEIIEHMMHDPTKTLYEIHRVLKPGGYLILSTPNPFRYTNYIRFLSGQNIYPPYSGHGAYARHHREFSADELRLLLKQCNYDVEELITTYDPAYDHPKSIDGMMRWLHGHGIFKEKMDVIHLRARAFGKPIYRYPPELYLDVHAYGRTVNDTVEMGVNDEAQLGTGFYKLENWPPAVRWTEKSAHARLFASSQQTLGIRFYSGPTQLGRPVTGKIAIGDSVDSFEVGPGEWAELKFPCPQQEGELEIVLRLDKSWTAKEVLGSSDTRPLGVAVQRIWLE